MINFTKYHGCGNDFVIIDEGETTGVNLSLLATKVCERHSGIGADGLIILRKHPKLEMIFFNQDGSLAPMCGNGIRCFARYCLDKGICLEDEYFVATGAGQMKVRLVSREPFLVQINMGIPDFSPAAFGVKSSKSDFLNEKILTSQGEIIVSSCFMGTIHTVVFVEDFGKIDVVSLGKEISTHPTFTEQTNVNFVKICDQNTIEIRTYERGAGLTLACGTGACASVIIGSLHGKCERIVRVLLPMGTLSILQNEHDEVMMTGPAEKICEGQFDIGG